jgi:pimeloyl-ACP methyl ester carboxylesterase
MRPRQRANPGAIGESGERRVDRRTFLSVTSAALGAAAAAPRPVWAAARQVPGTSLPPYGNGLLPRGIRSRMVSNVNGLTVHVIEAGYETGGRPAVLLLHGFPELAYSWRKVMLPLAAEGYHVIAPDQRGYGRTSGWDNSYDADPDPFRILNMVRDATALVYALGYRSVAMIAGHDAGAPVASWAALIRPDVFRSITILSSPFEGAPAIPFDTANGAAPPRRGPTDDELDAELAKLNPPRKYYQNYQRTRAANDNMLHAPQGLPAFFRAYYHYKSADWKGNHPHPLKARSAEEMAQVPTYYVMQRDKGMAETVAPIMPTAAEIAACRWLTDADVDVYAGEYGRSEFTGALQGYRVRRGSDPKTLAELRTFSGRSIDVPAMFIAGASDWGVYQTPGAVDSMRSTACSRMTAFQLIDGAGHWVQQEQHEQVTALVLRFLREQSTAAAKR